MNDYLLPPEERDWAALLAKWNWLLPDSFGVWMANAFGDLFIETEDGMIALLDINGGSLLPLADSRQSFFEKLADGENAAAWLYMPLVDALRASGKAITPGTCYAFTRPPLLGGRYVPENVHVTDYAEHLAFTGDFCEQLQGLEDGAEVELKVRGEDFAGCGKEDCCGGHHHPHDHDHDCDHHHHHHHGERCRDEQGQHYAGCDGRGGCGGKGGCGHHH